MRNERRREQQQHRRRQGGVHRRVYRGQAELDAEHPREYQVECGKQDGQAARDDTQSEIGVRATGAHRLPTGRRRKTCEYRAGKHDEHLAGTGRSRIVIAWPPRQQLEENELGDSDRQRRARPDDEIHRHAQQRQAQIVQPDVHRKAQRIAHDRCPLPRGLGRLRRPAVPHALRATTQQLPQKHRHENDELLDRSHEERCRDAIHLQVLRYHNVRHDDFHVQVQAGLHSEVCQQQRDHPLLHEECQSRQHQRAAGHRNV
mmetsp:Transcript_69878/g.202761  ORF Transcript_69878/g.202761 Transcript_69878/m.202761 type:complete len:259 (+) Transcript_69878:744-1520(+)